MIVTLYCFIFTAIIFTVIGKGLLFAYYKSAIKHYTLVDTYFIGLCLSGALLNIWSIFLPTDFISFLFLALLTLVLIGFNRFYYFSLLKKLLLKIKAEKILSLLLLGCLIITLLFAIVKPKLFDTYLYHINAIQWNEYYRAVPGLANLHDRFGFNSSMFVLSAGFSYSAIYNQYIFIISSLTFLMFFVWCVKKAYQKKGVVG
ncbi:MAG: LIC_10190 family membrane protein, partial [Flavobacterium sp.]